MPFASDYRLLVGDVGDVGDVAMLAMLAMLVGSAGSAGSAGWVQDAQNLAGRASLFILVQYAATSASRLTHTAARRLVPAHKGLLSGLDLTAHHVTALLPHRQNPS